MKQDQIYKLTSIFLIILFINDLRVESYNPPPDTFMSQILRRLAISLYKHVAKEEGNVVSSPFGYSSELAAILFATAGKTEEKLRKALEFDTESTGTLTPNVALHFYENRTKDAEKVNLHVANSVWVVDNKAEVNPEYRSIVKEYLTGDIYTFIYYSIPETRNMLRSWLTYKTGLRHQESTDAPTIMSPPSLIFLNAVWMNMDFIGARDGFITRPYDFTSLDDQKRKVKMMFFKGRFKYGKDSYLKGDYQVVEIPYRYNPDGEYEYNLVLIVPNQNKGAIVVDNIMNDDFDSDIFYIQKTDNVIVGIPEFAIQSELNLNVHFDDMTSNLFYRKYNMSKITKHDNIGLRYIIQSVTIQVHTDDDALSSYPIPELSDPRYTKVIADHPFFFVLRKTSGSLWHLMGRVTHL